MVSKLALSADGRGRTFLIVLEITEKKGISTHCLYTNLDLGVVQRQNVGKLHDGANPLVAFDEGCWGRTG